MVGTMNDPARLVAYMLEKGSVASVAAACFSRMAALAPDPSPESIAHLRTFVQARGVHEVVRLMEEHASVLDGDATGRSLNTEVLALADVQEQGCVLLMNLAGLALSGESTGSSPFTYGCSAATCGQPGCTGLQPCYTESQFRYLTGPCVSPPGACAVRRRGRRLCAA